MFSLHKPLLLLLIAFQTGPAVSQTPRSVSFDCSWIYDPPQGARERFEGVYYSFIDNSGFYPCSAFSACKDWMGKGSLEIAFSRRATAQLQKRGAEMYGIYKITFEGRRGKLRDRAGCERNWQLYTLLSYRLAA